MRCRFRAERSHAEQGSITAELAVAMPAVVLLVAFCVGAVGLAGQQVRLQHAAAQAARESGRQQADEVVCVTLEEAGVPPFDALTLTARSCAPGGGE